MPTDPTRAQTVFLAAAEITDPAARKLFLAEACGGDLHLQSRVEALLRAHDQPDSLLDVPLVAAPDSDHGATQALGSAPEPDRDSARTIGGVSDSSEDEEALQFLTPSARPDSLGRLGHYEVLQVLGKGGFGIVFRAFDDVLQRVVAVKVMAPHLAATSPARRRFLREARSSAQVRHENVVHVYEVGEQPLPYLVMEFVPGETLQQKLDRSGPLEVPEVLRIGRQVAEGLAAAHASDLIHRDIKPGNILLEGGSQKVKITDFGLARAADDASISQSGVIAGTPMFMAPEQALGQPIDQRADLFSFGSVLYQMTSGRPPFRAPSALAVLKRVVEETPRPIPEIIPETPDWLCGIIAKLHAKNPADRFQSAREVADLLADCEAQLKANSKVKDFNRIPDRRQTYSLRWMLAVSALLFAAVGVLGLYAMLTEWQLANRNPINPGGDLARIHVAKQEPPPLAVAPFDAVKAKEHQDAWAKHLGVDVEITNSIGMKLRLIPPGEFTAGTAADDMENLAKRMAAQDMSLESIANVRREGPPVQASVKQPFYLGTCEVTMGQFRAFVEAAKYQTDGEKSKNGGWSNRPGGWSRHPDHIWRTPGPWKSEENHPVVHVSWNDARAFCKWLGDKEGAAYTLPEGQQWEFAARAGTTALYGDAGNSPDSLFEVAWTRETQGGDGPHPVASKKANAFGLFDMLGNAYEWCLDPYPGVPGFRVVRGGSWYSHDFHVHPALTSKMREGLAPDAGTGFRVAVVGDLKAKRPPLAKQEPLPPTYKNSIGMEFVIVPKGKSWLDGGKDKLGDTEVVIPADFYLGKYEVTQEEWEKVMGERPSHFSRSGEGKDIVTEIADADLKRFPVENVTWDQCQLFAAKLNRMEKETGWVYRLPKEAEWEYACRGGPMADKLDSAFDFYFAKPTNTLLPEQANFKHDNGLNRTCKVGSYEPNALGLFDMHGNVWEWCDDTGKGASGESRRVLRGGACLHDEPQGCRAAASPTAGRTFRKYNGGLRLARVPSGTPSPEAKTPPIPAAKQESLPPTYTNSIGMEFVIVPKGKSWLGGGKDRPGDRPVTIPRDFYLGKYVVTQEEWQKVMGKNPSHFSRGGDGKEAVKYVLDADLKRFPVEQVSWDDAQEFLANLNDLDKNAGWAYRLPNEWEWEYACRGGPMADPSESAFDFYFEKPTNRLLPDQANFEHGKGLKRTCAVGSYQPNRLGLFDMHGNVWEWSDEAEGGQRVVRGGCSFRDAVECRAAYRYGIQPERRLTDVGLRVARVPTALPLPEPK